MRRSTPKLGRSGIWHTPNPDSMRGSADKRSVVGLTGLEPVTSALSGQRSNRLSYRPVFLPTPKATADRGGMPNARGQPAGRLRAPALVAPPNATSQGHRRTHCGRARPTATASSPGDRRPLGWTPPPTGRLTRPGRCQSAAAQSGVTNPVQSSARVTSKPPRTVADRLYKKENSVAKAVMMTTLRTPNSAA